MRMTKSIQALVLAMFFGLSGAALADTFSSLPFRFIGPPGNRVSAVTGEPGNRNVYYVGAASGGVWKSTDGGFHWHPIFDKEPVQSIGAIAVAPSDHNIVWVGTGETFIRSDVSIGDGVYKSTDGGKTWGHMGLEATGRIGRVLIDPRDPNRVFVAAMGTCYGPQEERGVYRTTDGGRTWKQVLFVDENTGASGLTMDPKNPDILFAGTWQIKITPWDEDSGGPGSGVYVSRNGGDSWTHITGHGLPAPPLGKIDVAIAPSNPERVYALIETGQRGSLWRSDDQGENWKEVNASRLLNERPHYYTRMLVMPDNANEVYFPSNGMSVTYDGGETTTQIPWDGDNHDMWADPLDPSRMMIGHDLGVSLTTTRGREWSHRRLPIGQIYHGAADDNIPYNVYGQMQDYASLKGPSRDTGNYIIPAADWTTTAGCETGWNIPDPVDPRIVWGSCYAGGVERFDAKTGMARSVSIWPESAMGSNGLEVKYRMNWTAPIAISPFDHNTVYVGTQYVMETADGGQSWKRISPDLTLDDKSRQGDSGGLTTDNLSVYMTGVVYSIAESSVQKGVIWAGTNDGQVQVTRDGGDHWANVTHNIPKLPSWGAVDSVTPSPFDAGTCYIAVDLHQMNNRDPFIYKTADFGETWKNIGSAIPKSPFSYVHVVAADPVRRGLLFAGTENSLYVSSDDGERWEPLQSKLPHAPIYWLTVQPRFHDLVVATYGRGFFILDDLTPLEQLTSDVRQSAAYLFAPRSAYRFRRTFRRDLAPTGNAVGFNPRYGASINYWLKAPPSKNEKITLDILGPDGQVIRQLKATSLAGLNRVWWDLRYKPTQDVRLRLTPPGNPHIGEEKRFVGKDSRPVLYYGLYAAKLGPLVVPGDYTVRLSAGGKEYEQKLTVLKDPRSVGTPADLEAQARLSMEIYRGIDTTAGMINQLEWTRKEIQDFQKMLAEEKNVEAVVADTKRLDKAAAEVEDKLLSPTLEEGDQKSFRGPLQLYLKFINLQAQVASGGGNDASGGADFAPTVSDTEVFDLLSGRLSKARADFKQFYEATIPAFNQEVGAKGYHRLVTVTGSESSPESSPGEEDNDPVSEDRD